jgi:23S rRNA-/tRNA-specific pseudouridylate synthase
MSKPQVNSSDYTQSAGAQQPLTLAIPPHLSGVRLDQALAELLPQYSRSRLQTWIVEGAITLDGAAATAKRKVWGGEQVQVAPHAHPSEASPQAEEMALDIVFEDDAILVINKPAGLVVHPGSGNWSGTLMNALLHHAPQLQVVPRAGIVHRLDKETSGLLVVAKTLEAQTDLVRQLQARTVKRHYLAVVEGVVARDGRVEAPIGRHPTARVKMAVVSRGMPFGNRAHTSDPGAYAIDRLSLGGRPGLRRQAHAASIVAPSLACAAPRTRASGKAASHGMGDADAGRFAHFDRNFTQYQAVGARHASPAPKHPP